MSDGVGRAYQTQLTVIWPLSLSLSLSLTLRHSLLLRLESVREMKQKQQQLLFESLRL